MAATTSDRIEKKGFVRAPRPRVWNAIIRPGEFGEWFGVKLDGDLAPGRRVTGRITHTGYEHLELEMTVERIEPEKLFSFRWHPHAVDPKADYSKEPPTLVELRLEDAPGGTNVTVVESGFERIPSGRRDEAYRMNDQGWDMQVENLRLHVGG